MGENISFTSDAVVFTIRQDELQILLIKRKKDPFKGMYALPGGFVEDNEKVEDTASRELYEETGVKNIFLKKFDVYSEPGRDPRGRVVTVAFIALISSDKIKLKSKDDAESADWFSVYELPKLGFDHNKVIKDSLKQLRLDIQMTNIAFQILPKKFTLSELQNTYELVLDIELDKRNFRKRIKELDIVLETNEQRMDGAHRPAKLYMFKYKEYKTIKEKVHVFV